MTDRTDTAMRELIEISTGAMALLKIADLENDRHNRIESRRVWYNEYRKRLDDTIEALAEAISEARVSISETTD